MIRAGMSLVAYDDDNFARAWIERIADPYLTP